MFTDIFSFYAIKCIFATLLLKGGNEMESLLPGNEEVMQSGQHPTTINTALFQNIVAGDKEAFHFLYQETFQSVYVFLLSIVQNKEDAEDILQETYIRVRLHADKYEDQGKPLAWIFTIARNLALMRLRDKKKSSYQDFDTLQIAIAHSDIEHAEDRMVLTSAFRVLTEEERTIVLLHAASGFKHREIAQLFNKPLATVLSKYRRAIKKLQQEMSRNGKG